MQDKITGTATVLGLSSTGYSWLIAVTDVAQAIGAVLGAVLSAIALGLYAKQYIAYRRKQSGNR